MRQEYENVNTNKLHDELITSGIIPTLVESKDGTTWITFADGTDMDAVQAIVDAHDPTPLPATPTAEDRLDAMEEAILSLMGL